MHIRPYCLDACRLVMRYSIKNKRHQTCIIKPHAIVWDEEKSLDNFEFIRIGVARNLVYII